MLTNNQPFGALVWSLLPRQETVEEACARINQLPGKIVFLDACHGLGGKEMYEARFEVV